MRQDPLHLLLGVAALATPVFSRPSLSNYGSMSTNSLFGRAESFDSDDLSSIKSIAAIGDSYSAGIGAGSLLGGYDNFQCRRYDHSYPYLLNQDGRLGDPDNRKFQFESCSGAVINDVLEKQIPEINSNQDLITLSAGGNDAELVNILNQCIYQWLSFSKDQKALNEIKKLKDGDSFFGMDFDVNGRSCREQLNISEDIINSDEFAENLDRVIEQTKKKLSKDGMIYYTGYAKFFGTDYSNECDEVSWSVWWLKAYSLWSKTAYLSSINRITMNRLVDLINEKLEAATERAGDQVKFVNYDEWVGRYKGRFCEKGVDESTQESENRPWLMFFEMSSKDLILGSNPLKRSTVEFSNGTFEANMNAWAKAAEAADKKARLRHGASGASDEGVKAIEVPESANSFSVSEESDLDWVPNLLPDGYGRVFHPQIVLHEIIADLILFHASNRRSKDNGRDTLPLIGKAPDTCTIDPGDGDDDGDVVLKYKPVKSGESVKKGAELRILPVGDSITVGFLSDQDGGDGNGYRGQLKKDLSGDKVVFAGTETKGSMSNGYFAAWSGKTIQYISDHVQPSLEQRPNIILLAAGTNDMNPRHSTSTEGNDPNEAAKRLGKLIDKMVKECPDATILVSMIISTCHADQQARTQKFQQLIPGVVKSRKDAGKHVLAADFTSFKTSDLRTDCIHPSNHGYKVMGDYWYSFIHQIPEKWIKKPVGPDPDNDDVDDSDNGGIDKNIHSPDWGKSPIQETSKDKVAEVAKWAKGGEKDNVTCKAGPEWKGTGKIATGKVGYNGDWKYHKAWKAHGKVADGLGLDNSYVRLVDMDGDGKADYVWIDPKSGEIRCWINNLPGPWVPAGNNKNGIIGSGVGPAKTIYLADMNGDGMADYLVVNPNDGSVRVWWNFGPDENWDYQWKFVQGGEIASGVPHANLATLRFPDINGDGRADYVYIGEGGALKHHMNVGTTGGKKVVFHAMGGIATGAVRDISKLVFADMNGDGRDDYLIWDDDGGLTGFLNQATNREGVPKYENQGKAKTIADGIGKDPSTIRLADIDGDGKDDYVFVGDHGALSVWYNRGTTEDNLRIDGLRFADIDGDGIDDYVWVDPKSGAPTVFINEGPDDSDGLGWKWNPLNGGKPIASGAAPGSQVMFGDMDGDGYDDYLDVDPNEGVVKVYLNDGKDKDSQYGWKFKPIKAYDMAFSPEGNVRFADIDGDGYDDLIYLKPNGGTRIYRNDWDSKSSTGEFKDLPEADASGISQSPDEIELIDVNGDGKADYVWTRKLDGQMTVWYNQYPKKPIWKGAGVIAAGVGTSGANIRYANLQSTGRADYVAVDPVYGSIAAWLNGCSDPQEPPEPPGEKPDPSKNEKHCFNSGVTAGSNQMNDAADWFCDLLPVQQDGDRPFYYREWKKESVGKIRLSFELKDGCTWKYDKDECTRYFRVPIDSCDCSSDAEKQGGHVENNCIVASIDPNF